MIVLIYILPQTQTQKHSKIDSALEEKTSAARWVRDTIIIKNQDQRNLNVTSTVTVTVTVKPVQPTNRNSSSAIITGTMISHLYLLLLSCHGTIQQASKQVPKIQQQQRDDCHKSNHQANMSKRIIVVIITIISIIIIMIITTSYPTINCQQA